MPFFKFRRGDTAAAPASVLPAQAQSIDDLRKRARHRLIGASLLVLLGIVGFPLVFDTQPRPVASDIPIEIPGKNSARPPAFAAPATSAAPGAPVGVATGPAAALTVPARPAPPAPASLPEKVAAAASLGPQEELFPPKPALPAKADSVPAQAKARPESKPESRPDAKPRAEAKPAAKAVAKADAPSAVPAAKPPASDDDGARAIALLNGGATQKVRAQPQAKPAAVDSAPVAEAAGRTVVQVGAFADTVKADETRRKLERAGLKTYTQVAETKDGKRIRVRVGPFATKAEAEKAGAKIRSLDLPVAILSF